MRQYPQPGRNRLKPSWKPFALAKLTQDRIIIIIMIIISSSSSSSMVMIMIMSMFIKLISKPLYCRPNTC